MVFSVGILLCELLNGVVPYADKPPTLIMLEKLKGCQPLVMDKSTISQEYEDHPDYQGTTLYYIHYTLYIPTLSIYAA